MVTPIFIIGVPRSGTTLLRTILDSHSLIAAAPETPWILGGYGPLSLRELIAGLIDHKTGPVKNLKGISDELIYSAGLEFLNKILETYLSARKKDFLVLKTPNDIKYLEFLARLFPDSKYIHIFRDGRDVACSLVNKKGAFFGKELRGFGELNYENAMRMWYAWESKIRRILIDNKNISHISISYEDLVTKTKSTTQKVCQVLSIDFEETMLDYYLYEHDYPEWEAGSADVKNKFGIDEKSIGRWKAEISKKDLIKIERQYGDFLKKLGYTLMTDELNLGKGIAPVDNKRLKWLTGIGIKYFEDIINNIRRKAG